MKFSRNKSLSENHTGHSVTIFNLPKASESGWCDAVHVVNGKRAPMAIEGWLCPGCLCNLQNLISLFLPFT